MKIATKDDKPIKTKKPYSRKCPNNHLVGMTAVFCGVCGLSLEPEIKPPAIEPKPASPEKLQADRGKSKRSKWHLLSFFEKDEE